MHYGSLRRGRKRKKGEILFEEIMGKNPKSGKGSGHPDSRSPKHSNKDERRESTPRHIMSKLSKIKDKERILKATRQK